MLTILELCLMIAVISDAFIPNLYLALFDKQSSGYSISEMKMNMTEVIVVQKWKLKDWKKVEEW